MDKPLSPEDIAINCRILAEETDDEWLRGYYLAHAAWVQPQPTDR